MKIFGSLISRLRAESELSDAHRSLILSLVATDVLLKSIVWHFLYHLPKSRINGPKYLWGLLTSAVGTIGPVAFLCVGIKYKN
ncbi:hypothetical protein CIP107546_01138 [Corynebacterium diphtheriae]|nr:hypothetical protein BUE67_03400 [Corynebacterium diphtheriae]OLO14350.1 hypothetical protein BUV99_06020 [Corynebacterium diphtheriae]OLO22409.1 hypothetical protein BVH76_06395 [Corynebacterium diphtheriae]OLO24158.1 hypothetical protein BVH78_04115 [Corynebacterium diphtheriae]OMO44162.1 hypothetical protein BVL41_05615 [Corynebacterium diphtheriae]